MKLEVAEIKAFFSAPNPKRPEGETLTKESEPTLQANFHWVTYQVLFTAQDKGEDEPKYYIYSVDLTPDGKESLPNKIFESDSAWDPSHKDEPTPDLNTGDVKRQLQSKSGDLVLKSPELIKALQNDLKNKRIDHHDVTYVNTDKTDKGGVYSVEKFGEMFDNEFYVVLSGAKEKMNPLGKPVGISKAAMAVRIAMEGVQTGGRDIMRRLVQKQKAERGQEAPLSGDSAYTGGFGEMRKWQEQKQGQPAQDMIPGGEGYDVMKQVMKNPTPIKKAVQQGLKFDSGTPVHQFKAPKHKLKYVRPNTFRDENGHEVDSDDVQWNCPKCKSEYNEAAYDCQCGHESPYEIRR